jgi:ABC-type Fe3+-hydroxamate transport system substrate-binding protein
MRGRPSAPPRRIVSLVPSLTEALFALGLGERVVGVTEWCVHPADAVAHLPKLGGTKNPDLDAIRALAPDLVIANQEENRKRDVERLEAAGIPVWVTYPRTVREGAELLAEFADLGASADARARVVAPALAAVADAEAALAALRASGAKPTRVFCPIWRDPWMAVGAPTYADDLITLCGGENVFGANRLTASSEDADAAAGDARAAAATERRYPRVTLAEVEAAQPDVVLLPDEPYAFGPRDAADLARLSAPFAASGRIHLIDGTFVSWYGPRILRAIELLRRLLLGVTRG